MVNENTIDWLIQDLNGLGYPHATFDQLDPSHPSAWSCAGKEVTVRCEEHSYKGEMREQWSFSFGGGKLEVKPMEKSNVANLNALFGSKLKDGLNGKKPAANGTTSPAAGKPLSVTPQTIEEAI